MPRGKDQKTIAKRIDLHYWKKAHPLRSWRKALVLVCVLVAGGWMAYAFATKNDRIYNPGHVTSAHAMIENNCAACHAPDPNQKGQFLAAVSDTACMKCHEAPMHAPTQLVREGDNASNALALVTWMKANGMATETPAPAQASPAESESAPAPDAAPPADSAAAETSPATAQPMDTHHKGVLVSAQCAACHVEHRGREALAAVSNNHCTQCHADLNKAIAPGVSPKVPTRVVAFSKEDHPPFGRRLEKNEQGGVIDPTKLKFNHKVHIVDQKLNDCTMCHTTWQPNLAGSRPGRDETKPPFKGENDRPLAWAGASDGRYMQPVSYEQSCQACHPIRAQGIKGSFAHEKIEIVRAQVSAAFQQTAQERYDAGPPGEAAPKTGARRGSKPKETGPADEGEWLKGEIDKLNKGITSVQKSCAKCHEMKDESAPAVASARSAAMDRLALSETPAVGHFPDPLLLVADADFPDMLARGHETRLLGLSTGDHEVTFAQRRPGSKKKPAETPPAEAAPPAAPDAASGAPGATTPPPAAAPPAAPKAKPRKPITPVKLQTTEPTGIPNAPRRWFTASRFDHRSHRDMACVDCHSKLDNLDKIDGIENEAIKTKLLAASTETREMLSPGLEWEAYAFTKAGEGKWSVAVTTKACTDCHRADTPTQRFATDRCVTCHAYHDHSKELFPDGRPARRVETMVMAAPVAETPAEATPEATPPAAEPAPEAAPETPAAAPEATPTEAPATSETPAEPAPAEPAPAEPAPAETVPAEAVPADPAPAAPTSEAPAEPPSPAPEATPAEPTAPAEAEPAQPARKSRRPRSLPGA